MDKAEMTHVGLDESISGNSTIEFCLAFPILLAFVFGMIDVSIYLWSQSALRHAVTQAARCAGVGLAGCVTDQDIKSFATKEAVGLSIDPSAFTVSDQPCGKRVEGRYQYASAFGSLAPYQSAIVVTSCF
jgi:Flp pilus assembly protein TadG